MAGLILALWVPVTMHCLLERVSGMEILACDALVHAEEPLHPADPCEGDGCAAVESGDYALQVRDERFNLAWTTFVLAELPPEVLLPTLHAHPPYPAQARRSEMNACWQFVLRAAPLARAPSCFRV